MSRFPQEYTNARGSLRNIQLLINKYPLLVNSKIKDSFTDIIHDEIIWQSPLTEDDYAEYRDDSFIERVGLKHKEINLDEFWPRNGAQWDALATTDKRQIILVEAKANLPELKSPQSGAGKKSIKIIRSSLDETKKYLEVNSETDWSGLYYQYTNRLAHLYFLRVKRNIPAFLLNIYFVGDKSVNGPKSDTEWHAALKELKNHLGLTEHKLSKYIAELFIDVSEWN